ncbi:fungal-specific transcription factor domain-containing protein [Aspergillus crustosus]
MQTVLAKSNFDDIKAGYFSSVHAWMPIISKIKLERALHGLNSSLHADAALLLLCMKLVQTSPGPDKQTPHSLALYTIAKRFSKTLELDNVLTLRSIQAGILLTLYELGHGIFPAAYLSIAQCARQGVALGLHNKNAPQFLREPRSWADWEERQRVWWAIVILDRYIALGGEYRPLCTEDPERDTLLPANDSAWNNGEMVPPDRVSLSSQTTNTLGSFARLAQVANLLGRVIRHCNDTPLDISFTLDDFDTLIQALYSLLEMLPADHQASDDPTLARAICYSALFKLADHHTCNLFETDGQVLDEAIAPRARESMHKAFDVIRDTCGRVTILAQQIRNDLDLHLTSPRPHSSSHESTQRVVETASPLLCECLYTAAQNLLWMSLETNNPELGGWKGVCEEVLQGLDIRWGVAGMFIFLAGI